MQNTIYISLLGVGAVKVQCADTALYIDAYNRFVTTPNLEENDLLLFTHDDDDHFDVQFMPSTLGKQNKVITLHSVAYQLLGSMPEYKANLVTLYPHDYQDPLSYQHRDITITVYNTSHFLNHHNTHISFLIEYSGKRIYITGDSKIREENIQSLMNLDCLIYSLLEEKTVKEIVDRRFASYFNMVDLIKVKTLLQPNKIICNHLINCDWAEKPETLLNEVRSSKLTDVIVPLSPNERIEL